MAVKRRKWKSWNTLEKKLNLNYAIQEWREIKHVEAYFLVGSKLTQVCSMHGAVGEFTIIEATNLIIYN